jgi:phosphoribosylaminoimidazole carboxylase PurE protein
MSSPWVAIVMGSKSDLEVMAEAARILDDFSVPYEMKVLSAHRTPEQTAAYASSAEGRGVEVMIAGAGAAAHLAGVVAAHTVLPVIGVPLASSTLQGMDSLLATVQMPGGVPVASMAIGKAGAKNAALFSVQILGRKHPELVKKFKDYRRAMREKILATEV